MTKNNLKQESMKAENEWNRVLVALLLELPECIVDDLRAKAEQHAKERAVDFAVYLDGEMSEFADELYDKFKEEL